MIDRKNQLIDFANSSGYKEEDLLEIKNDASFRNYYRLINHNLLIMDADPAKGESVSNFAAIDKLLRSLGFSAPEIISIDVDNGFILLEDFGKKSFTELLSKDNEKDLLKRAVKVLCDLNIKVKSNNKIQSTFDKYSFEAVIHLAGLKSVKKSNEIPSEYFENNVQGTRNLISVMKKSKVKKLVFSSSATVYGIPKSLPIYESSDIGNTTSIYGKTKYMVENILREIWEKDNEWQICILRYFNPIGAHSSGLIGESPKGIPDNLLPYLFNVASGVLKELEIFGDDYSTPDGSGIRDYIHIEDLSKGHLCALEYLSDKHNISFFNLGTGNGF